MLTDEGPACIPGRGAELEEGFCSVSLQAGEEATVPFGAEGEERRAPLGSRLPSHPWATHTQEIDGCPLLLFSLTDTQLIALAVLS